MAPAEHISVDQGVSEEAPDSKARAEELVTGASELTPPVAAPPAHLPPPDGLDVYRVPAADEELVILSFPLGRPSGLTAAERGVTYLLLREHSNAEIAEVRGTSKRTVANQVAFIFRKLGLGSRAELLAAAHLIGQS